MQALSFQNFVSISDIRFRSFAKRRSLYNRQRRSTTSASMDGTGGTSRSGLYVKERRMVVRNRTLGNWNTRGISLFQYSRRPFATIYSSGRRSFSETGQFFNRYLPYNAIMLGIKTRGTAQFRSAHSMPSELR